MIHLAVFDIDRTIIPSQTGRIAPETADAIRALQQRGIRTAIGSGRMLHLIPDELRELGFDYYILSNGTYVADRNGQVVAQESVDSVVAEALTRELIRRELALDIRYVDGMMPGNPNMDVREAMQKYWARMGLKFKPPKNFRWHSPPAPESKPIAFGAYIPPEMQPEVFALFPQLDFLPVFDSPMCDINPKGVSKATGIQRICGMMGIGMEQVIAFGDDRNDLEMIAEAGIGVAMGNGIQAVKDAADYVTAPCEELGVVRALQRFGLLDDGGITG